MFKPVERGKRNFELIIEQLQDLFSNGSIKPGDRIQPERELAEILQVSRTSIREALKILEALDLVQVKPGEGTFLKKPTISGIVTTLAMFLTEESGTSANLFETRTLLESGIARLAATRRTEEDLAEMEHFYHVIMHSNQVEEFIQGDIGFHSSVMKAAKNPTLYSFSSLVSELMKYGIRKNHTVLFFEAGAKEISAQQHYDIFCAIQQKDPEKAYKAMYNHLEYTASQAIKIQAAKKVN